MKFFTYCETWPIEDLFSEKMRKDRKTSMNPQSEKIMLSWSFPWSGDEKKPAESKWLRRLPFCLACERFCILEEVI